MQQKLASVAGFEAVAKGETRRTIRISFTIEFQNGECGRICIIGQCAKMGNGASLTNDMRTGNHLFEWDKGIWGEFRKLKTLMHKNILN